MNLARFSDNTLSLMLFFSASLWGVFWIPLRSLEEAGLTGTWSVIIFNLAGLVLLGPYVLWKRKSELVDFRFGIIIAVFVGMGFSLYSVSLLITDVVRATMLFYLTSIWSSVIGYFWLNERLGRARGIAIALGFAGLFFLVSGGGEASNPLGVGDLMALCSGIAWAMGASCIKKWPNVPVTQQAVGTFLFTAIYSFLFGILLYGWVFPTPSAIFETMPLAFGASWILLVPSSLLMLAISKRLFPGRVGILMMSEVFVAIFTATLLLPEEVMTLMQWMGGGLIIAACFCEVFAGANEPA